jgi:hypothetical protein
MGFKYDIETENDSVRSWRRGLAGVSGNGEARATSKCCALGRARARQRTRVRPPLYAERASVPRFPGQPGSLGLTLRCVLSPGDACYGRIFYVPVS